jgi:hypothetical protein
MTDLEALDQARARWGAAAVVHVERVTFGDGETTTIRSVGRIHDAHSWDALGQGRTWPDAFAEADARTATRTTGTRL